MAFRRKETHKHNILEFLASNELWNIYSIDKFRRYNEKYPEDKIHLTINHLSEEKIGDIVDEDPYIFFLKQFNELSVPVPKYFIQMYHNIIDDSSGDLVWYLIRLEDKLRDEYRDLCKKHGLNMSQRFRNFINEEIKELKNKK